MAGLSATPPSTPERRMARNVVVIGARMCGTAATVHLVDSLAPDSRITVVDPQNPGYPSVFDDIDPILTANTSHGINSLFPTRPMDFVDFLSAPERACSVPRQTVGRYGRVRLEQACEKAAHRGIEVRQLTGRVNTVAATAAGYEVGLDDGRSIRATDVIIAVGQGDVRQPPGICGVPPFPSTRLRQMAGRHALVMGQGQSGIDAALVLRSAGSLVTMCSRTGRFPAVRTRTPLHAYEGARITDARVDFRRLVDKDCRSRGHLPFAEQQALAADPISALREEIRLAEQDRCPWQDSIVGIIDAVMDASASVVDDREFLWRYVNSINLHIARQLLTHIDEGGIGLAALDAVDLHDFDLVVTATGHNAPSLYHQGRTLHFENGDASHAPVQRLSRDLRLILSDTQGPERIWAIGPASGIRLPFANFLHTAARQAVSVARQIGQDARARTL